MIEPQMSLFKRATYGVNEKKTFAVIQENSQIRTIQTKPVVADNSPAPTHNPLEQVFMKRF